MAYPANLKYTKEHEWILVEGSTGSIGITDYAQDTLGDIVSDLFSPVSGTVTAVNTELESAPEKINAAANSTWIIKVKITNLSELDALLTAEAYEQFIKEEGGH